jgi:hypothetical protein
LPEKPVGSLVSDVISGWSKATIWRNLEAVRNGVVTVRKLRGKQNRIAGTEVVKAAVSSERCHPVKRRSQESEESEFRRLLLALLNAELPPQAQKTQLPRGFFGPYLKELGLELVDLPEKPTANRKVRSIYGWRGLRLGGI